MRNYFIVFLLLPMYAFAETEPSSVQSTICEAEMNAVNSTLSREARAFLGLVRLGLRDGDIPLENVKWLESQSEIANPVSEGRNLRNSSLSRGIERVRSQVPSTEWGVLKDELRKLGAKMSEQATKTEVARDATYPVYGLRALDIDHKVATEHIKIFVSRKNEIFFYGANSKETFVTELQSGRTHSVEESPAPNPEMVDFFEGRDGQVYFSWVGRKKICILNLNSGDIIFEKPISSDEILLDAQSLAVTVAPIVFEAPEGLRIALVAPPGTPSGEREKGLVIFDHRGNKLRSGSLPPGQANVSRLENGNLYAYGIGSLGASEDKVKLYIDEVGQGISGIEAWAAKERFSTIEGQIPRLYLDNGRAQMIFLLKELASPLLYNQMTSRVNPMPGIRQAFFDRFEIFTSSRGRPSFVGLDLKEVDSTQLPVLKSGEIGNLRSVQEHPLNLLNPRSALTVSRVLKGPSGPLVVLWELSGARLKAVNILDLNTGHLVHLPVPAAWQLSEVSQPFYDSKSDRLMVMLKNVTTFQWELFQLYGKPN